MKAATLYSLMKKIIVGLEHIGYRIICVITDNAINGKAMSLFAQPPKLSIVFPHPAQHSRPLFFMFDCVHLLKCFRNNWINQKDAQKTMKFPKFSTSSEYTDQPDTAYAPFSTLRKLYSLEADSLLKHSYKLTMKAISPSTLERQNVKFAQQIFSEYVIQGLLSVGGKHCLPFFSDVADYIKVVYTWWPVMIVQAPHKGIWTNNVYATPPTDRAHDKNTFLDNFYIWPEKWDTMEGVGGKLTQETFTALRHTTHAVQDIAYLS